MVLVGKASYNMKKFDYANDPRMSKSECVLLGFSGLLIFVAYDDSFNMQITLPVFVLLLFGYLKKTGGAFSDRIGFSFCVVAVGMASASVILNLFIDPKIITDKTPLRILYLIEILLFYYVTTKRSYASDNLKLILIAGIVSGLAISLAIIWNYQNGAVGKISVTNIFGRSVEENYTAGLIVFEAMLCLLGFRYTQQIGIKTILLCILLVMTYAILLTGSRAAIVALAVGIAIFVVQNVLSGKVSLFAKIGIVALVFLFVAVIVLNADSILPRNLYDRIFVSSYADSSNAHRLELWSFGLEGFLRRPFFGYGIGNYNYYVINVLGMTQHTVVVAHNTYLDALLDLGIVGLLPILALVLGRLKGVARSKVLFPAILSTLFTALIVGGERTFFFWNAIVILTILIGFAGKSGGNGSLESLFDFSAEVSNVLGMRSNGRQHK